MWILPAPKPDECPTKNSLHLASACSGGGGLDLGVSLLLEGARCICWIEWEAFAAEILASGMEAGHLAPAPLFSDVRAFDGKPWRGCVDIFTAGYPCQPFSLAGQRRGTDDPRHLWPHIARILGEFDAPIGFFENVGGHLSLGFEQVARTLQDMDYDVAAGLFTASEVGASHKRERLFILAIKRGYPGLGNAFPAILNSWCRNGSDPPIVRTPVAGSG